MFDVEWEEVATDHFASICMAHPDRWKDINSADNHIISKLRREPLRHGHPVSEGLLRVIAEPLAVYFTVSGQQSCRRGCGLGRMILCITARLSASPLLRSGG